MNTAIKKAQEAMARARAAGTVERLNPIEKAIKNPKSLRAAINGKCFDCSCHERSEISNCTVRSCTLWRHRPYQKGGDDDE
jgi:hypothetical protein